MSKIRKSAQGEGCLVRVPLVCNGDSSTVVLAHLGGAGMGMKHLDIHGAYCCSSCHDSIDRRVNTQWSKDELLIWHMEGIFRTQKILIEKGLLEVKK